MEDTTIIIEETLSEMSSEDTYLSDKEDTIVIESYASEDGSGEIGQLFEDYSPIITDDTIFNSYSDGLSYEEQDLIKQKVFEAISEFGLDTGNGDTFNLFNVSIDKVSDVSTGVLENPEDTEEDSFNLNDERVEESIEEGITEGIYTIDDLYLKMELIEGTVLDLRDNQIIEANNTEIQLSYIISGLFVLVGGLAIKALFNHIRP